MNQDELKRRVGRAAVKFVKKGEILGVGTGSTVNHFIEALTDIKDDIPAAVSSSSASTEKLKEIGIPVIDLNDASEIGVYVDGADETNHQLQLIKGGGAALTREKIIAAVAKQFVCIADESKLVSCLGSFPLPVEVVPMARSYVARELVKLGGKPVYRENIITDNHNIILDVHDLEISEPAKLETLINQITGVVTNGIFGRRGADVLLLGTESEVNEITLD